MFAIENAIRSVTRTASDKLNIVVMCDNEEDYISTLCQTGHNFYILQDIHESQWKRSLEATPSNLTICPSFVTACNRHYDLIIVFNRLTQWDKANKLSAAWHVPIIVVDIATFNTKLQHPFFVDVSVETPEKMHTHGGEITVGSSEIVTGSWTSPHSKFATTIHSPYNPPQRELNPRENNRIAIDSDIEQNYLRSLPITLTNGVFSQGLSDAAFYLHLWKCVTPKMLEAMMFRIPVITFESLDFKEFIDKEAVILIQELQVLNQPNIMRELKAFPKQYSVVENAFNIVSERHSPEKFLADWNHIFNHSISLFYTRG